MTLHSFDPRLFDLDGLQAKRAVLWRPGYDPTSPDISLYVMYHTADNNQVEQGAPQTLDAWNIPWHVFTHEQLCQFTRKARQAGVRFTAKPTSRFDRDSSGSCEICVVAVDVCADLASLDRSSGGLGEAQKLSSSRNVRVNPRQFNLPKMPCEFAEIVDGLNPVLYLTYQVETLRRLSPRETTQVKDKARSAGYALRAGVLDQNVSHVGHNVVYDHSPRGRFVIIVGVSLDPYAFDHSAGGMLDEAETEPLRAGDFDLTGGFKVVKAEVQHLTKLETTRPGPALVVTYELDADALDEWRCNTSRFMGDRLTSKQWFELADKISRAGLKAQGVTVLVTDYPLGGARVHVYVRLDPLCLRSAGGMLGEDRVASWDQRLDRNNFVLFDPHGPDHLKASRVDRFDQDHESSTGHSLRVEYDLDPYLNADSPTPEDREEAAGLIVPRLSQLKQRVRQAGFTPRKVKWVVNYHFSRPYTRALVDVEIAPDTWHERSAGGLDITEAARRLLQDDPQACAWDYVEQVVGRSPFAERWARVTNKAGAVKEWLRHTGRNCEANLVVAHLDELAARDERWVG